VLAIEIEYLRAMFEGDGTGFNIHLQSCTRFRYGEHDEDPIDDLERIQEREPEVLYVPSEHPLILDCMMGALELEYGAMSVTLDSGVRVTEEELAKVGEQYWQRWGESAKSEP
jgi:hypothetical protein